MFDLLCISQLRDLAEVNSLTAAACISIGIDETQEYLDGFLEPSPYWRRIADDSLKVRRAGESEGRGGRNNYDQCYELAL